MPVISIFSLKFSLKTLKGNGCPCFLLSLTTLSIAYEAAGHIQRCCILEQNLMNV